MKKEFEEALEKLESIREYSHSLTMVNYLVMNSDLDIVEQTLLKAQEQEKALKIIFEKNVDIDDIKLYKNYEDYCKGKEKWLLRKDLWLTEKEFDTLKRWKNENCN